MHAKKLAWGTDQTEDLAKTGHSQQGLLHEAGARVRSWQAFAPPQDNCACVVKQPAYALRKLRHCANSYRPLQALAVGRAATRRESICSTVTPARCRQPVLQPNVLRAHQRRRGESLHVAASTAQTQRTPRCVRLALDSTVRQARATQQRFFLLWSYVLIMWLRLCG